MLRFLLTNPGNRARPWVVWVVSMRIDQLANISATVRLKWFNAPSNRLKRWLGFPRSR
jgi:hypothetical protein